jgi:hypothetical protein
MSFQGASAHRLASLGAADLHPVPPDWLGMEIMVKTDHAMNLGTRQIQAGGYRRHGLGRDVTQLTLERLQ